MFNFFGFITKRLDAVLRANAAQAAKVERLEALLTDQATRTDVLRRQLDFLHEALAGEVRTLGSHLGAAIQAQADQKLVPADFEKINPHFSRNFLPNDDAATQKSMIFAWRQASPALLTHQELADSGFRVFSQNDEDGVILRIFSHIGWTNRYVIEIGSNCSGSDIGIPENLSTNLIVNHGWHGTIIEMDQIECGRMRYFFARDYATRHFHRPVTAGDAYFSPNIIPKAVDPENVESVLLAANKEREPDLLILDIDGGDFAVMRAIQSMRPRVVIVEFEKRFRDRYSVYQKDRRDFSLDWPQSGSVSLPAWEKMFEARGYVLCAVGSCGFNAFFVRADVAEGFLETLTCADAFNSHPIFSSLSEDFWLTPNKTWLPF